MLRQLPKNRNRKVLVDASTADDAGVYRLGPDQALVLTADFFTPIVDDPHAYGQIAAAHAITDVYAMGGRPLTALNLLGFPPDLIPAQVIHAILRGAALKAREAGCAIVGGHTIRNPEPVYGLAVTGLVSPRRMLANTRARPGDRLVLTKPLGTGIMATALKRGQASPSLVRRATRFMAHLNRVGAELAERGLIRAATDVSGFGLLGHLIVVCQASGVGAEIQARHLPMISPEISGLIARDCVPGGTRSNLEAAEPDVVWHRVSPDRRLLLADAQTGGGLLLCVPPRRLQVVLRLLRRHHSPCAVVIGQIIPARRPRIVVR